jgi:hypothetical protein
MYYDEADYAMATLEDEPEKSLSSHVVLDEVRAMLDSAMQLLTTREFCNEDEWLDDYEELWERYDNSFPKD